MMSLVGKLKELKDNNAISMHVPGHKNMTIGHLHQIDMNYDMTEIPGLDNLHYPEDVLEALNHTLSKKYSGYSAQAVVNGSTTGVLASIFTAAEQVDEFIIIGDAHKSVYHALDLLNISFTTISSEDAGEIKQSSGVVITHPSYLGEAFKSLHVLIDSLHQKGALVIVDEAHGAHNDIAEGFVKSAMNYKADFVIQSYHKMLPALTGASVIYTRSDRDMNTVRKYIDYFETSSPSYLIMASIELAEQFYHQFEAGVFFRKRNTIIKALKSNGFEVEVSDDPAKLIVKYPGMSGDTLEYQFRDNHIYSEMKTEDGVLWCLPLFHEADSFPLEMLLERINHLTLAEQTVEDNHSLDISILLGKTCIRTIVPYPPGIPAVLKGDIFHEEVLLKVQNYIYNNVKIEGIRDNINYYMNEDDA